MKTAIRISAFSKLALIVASIGSLGAGSPESQQSIPAKLESIKSLTAKEAVELAIANSLKLQAVGHQKNAADAKTRAAISAFLPTLDLQLTGGSTRKFLAPEAENNLGVEKQYSEVNQNHYLGQLLLNQSLYKGFESFYSLSLEKARRAFSEIEYNRMREETVREVLDLYFGIQLHTEEIAAEIDVKKQRENYFEDIKRMTAMGRTTRLSALQAEYAVKSQVPVIQRLYADLESSTLQLHRLTGIELSSKLELKESLDQGFLAVQNLKIESAEVIYQKAMTENFDLQSAKNSWEQISHEASISQAKHHPKLDLIVNADINANQRSEITETHSRSYTVALQMTVPLFSGFDSFASTSERMARKSEAQSRIDDVQANLLVTIQNNLSRWRLTLSTIDAEKSNLELAEESIKNALSLFAAGRATATEVLDSYARKLAAKRNIAKAKFEHILLAVDLQRLQGKKTQTNAEGAAL